MPEHPIASIRDGAIELLQRGWIQGYSAHDDLGEPVGSDHPAACAWCLTGAIDAALHRLGTSSNEVVPYSKFLSTWFKANESCFADLEDFDKDDNDREATAILFNDMPCMTQEQVVASLKRIQPT